MNIFKYSEGEMAKYFVENPESYSTIVNFLKTTIDKKLEENLAFIEKANKIALDSKYFIFETYDSWAANQGMKGEGHSLFRKVNDGMSEIIDIDEYGAPELETIISYLNKNNINKIFTTPISSEGYFGLKSKSVDELDRHVMEYQSITNPSIPNYLKEKGIELILLKA